MRSTRLFGPLAALGLLWLAASAAPAQQVTVTTPFHSVNDGFFEQFGTHWGFNYKGLNFSFGGPNMAVPQFGMFDPNAGIRGGWSVQGSDYSGFFNFAAGQGFRQSLVTQAPSVTLTNGYPGYFGDVSQSPFVVGLIPIVGGLADTFPIGPWPCYTTGCPPYLMGPQLQAMPQGNPRVQAMLRQPAEGNRGFTDDPSDPLLAGLPGGGPAPPRGAGWQVHDGLDLGGGAALDVDPSVQKLAAAQSSSAGRAVPSVAEAQRLRQLEEAARSDEVRVLYERGLTAEEGGKPGVAKIYYNMALKSATGEFRDQILARLKALSSADTPE
jgi:hypothetical protein